MIDLYSALLLATLIATAPWWLWQIAAGKRYRAGLAGRLGRLPPSLDEIVLRRPSSAGLLWLHAVSVGEVLAAEKLLAELQSALPAWQFVVSTTTETGQQIARQRLAAAAVFFFPLDFAFSVRRYLRALKPTLFVSMESELWPRMIVECRRSSVPFAVVNARISDRSLPRYLRLRRLWKPLLGCIALFCAQGEEAAHRLLRIGAPPDRVQVTGNLKLDAAPADASPLVRRIRSLLGTTRLLVAGSTLPGEEAMLLEAWPALLVRVPDAVMLIAPRHPQRFAEVFRLLASGRFAVVRCSTLPPDAPEIAPGTILLLDTLGDLGSAYGIATAALIGGSLVAKGGHNPVEAVRFGIPVLMGESYDNFREMVEPMRAAGTITIVTPADLPDALAAAIERAGTQPAGSHGLPAGATEATLKALLALIASQPARVP